MNEQILVAEEVATILRVDRQRIYELVRTGAIPFIRIGERQYRFSRIAIDNWLGLNVKSSERSEVKTDAI